MAGSRSTKGPSKADGAQLFDQAPPSNVEAEQSVLGGLLCEPAFLGEYAADLRAEHFYDAAHRSIFSAMLDVLADGGKLDVVLLVDELRKRKQFEAVGGAAYLAKLSSIVPTTWHLEKYVAIVIETSKLRSIIEASTVTIRDAYERNADSRSLIHQQESRLAELADVASSQLVTVKEGLLDAIERLEQLKTSGAAIGLPTGFDNYDERVGGFHESELAILAARPSTGKTAWALNVATNVAKGGKNVLFVSLEMSRFELTLRLLASEARINGHRLRHGSASPEDWSRIRRTFDELSPAGLVIDDHPRRSVLDIEGAARSIRRRRGSLALVVVDYLQLVEPVDANLPRQEQVAGMARALKGLARELKIPVLCLAQLNRQAEASKDNRPRLSHLRESGAIEQDADVVLFIHREELHLSPGPKRDAVAGEAEIIVAKNRNGPTLDVELTWRKDFMRFEDRAPERFGEFDAFNQGAYDGPVRYDEFD